MSSPFDDVDLPEPTNQDAAGFDFYDAPTEEVGQSAPAPSAEDDPFGAPEAAHSQPEAKGQEDVFGEPAADQSTGFDEMPAEPQADEVTALSLWEAERRKVLASRLSAESDSRDAQLANAKKEINSFYQQREETLQKTKTHNRMDEENTKKDLESLFQHGNTWEKVARLVNLQAKSNEDRRIGRMRKLLVHLKNDRDNTNTGVDADD